MSKLVSIIIPVYNGEQYMRKAIDSALAQTYPTLEILIIDDGSCDRSFAIAEEYQRQDSRVRTYSQKNQGSAVARNRGILMSRGEYIQFLDCDDTLEKDAVGFAVGEMQKTPEADFLLFGFYVYSGETLLRTPNPGSGVYRPGNGYSAFGCIERLMASPCNKFYKKTYITHLFEEKMLFAEDLTFNYNNITPITTIRTTEKCLYNVQLNTGNSVNKRYKEGKIRDYLISQEIEEEKLHMLFPKEFDVELYRENRVATVAYLICICISTFSQVQAVEELKKVSQMRYFDYLLSCRKRGRLQDNLLLSFVEKRQYGLVLVFGKLLNFIRSKLHNK